MKSKDGLNRRGFLKSGIAGGLGMAAISGAASSSPSSDALKKILNYQEGMRYRRLGKTDIHLSVISMGGLVINESVHNYAIDRGVNLVHIADRYLQGQAIETLGKILKNRRSQVYVALKDDYSTLDDALRKLQTDHVDFLMFAKHNEAGARDPRNLEILENYRRQGKVRFAGLTTHDNIKPAMAAGLETGIYSLMMPSLNQPSLELLDSELQTARQKGVGIMAMKTMRGISDPSLQTAYLKKLLRNESVTTVVKGIGSFELFDALVLAAQEELTLSEDRLLYRHAQSHRAVNCMMCGECEAACPQGVAVSTILRCKDYYYEQMGDLPTALANFREIPLRQIGDSECGSCRLCERACPNGVRIVERLAAARRMFASPNGGLPA
jgi:uncharacterized protein